MLNKKLGSIPESKLSKTINSLTIGTPLDKTGFIKNSNKSSLFKTKSFRLRESDFINLSNIVSHVNNNNARMVYSDSQVIRGLINYISDTVDSNLEKVLLYIQNSS